jgi:hypothetical protein
MCIEIWPGDQSPGLYFFVWRLQQLKHGHSPDSAHHAWLVSKFPLVLKCILIMNIIFNTYNSWLHSVSIFRVQSAMLEPKLDSFFLGIGASIRQQIYYSLCLNGQNRRFLVPKSVSDSSTTTSKYDIARFIAKMLGDLHTTRLKKKKK